MSFLTKLPRELYKPDAFATFDAQTSDFHPGVAKAMAWMCQLTYETNDPTKIASIGANFGITVPTGGIISEEIVTPLPQASTQAIVCERTDAVIVGFSGTDPVVLADWISDFDIGITTTGSANGFAVAAQAVEKDLNDVLATLSNEKPIFVTGHSLGGALAVLAAHRLNSLHPGRIRAVYTYGMPRPGNEFFANDYNAALGERTYRLVHGNDVVPTVAPSSFGFRHVGRPLRCASREKFDANALVSLAEHSDAPAFERGISVTLKNLLHGRTEKFPTDAQRKALAAILSRKDAQDIRTDPGGLIIELLPPPLRDHMPDRYIQAAS